MVEKAKIKLKKSKNYLVYAVRYVIYLARLFWWKVNHDSKWTKYTKYIISPFKKVKRILSPYVGVVFGFISKYLKKAKGFFEKHPKIKWTTIGTIILLLITIPLYSWWSSIPRAPGLKTASGDYLYFAKGEDFTAFLGEKSSNRPVVQFEVNDGAVKFTPASGASKMMEPARDGKTLTFRNVYQNIDYQYQTIPKGVKEDIIIREPTIIRNFPFFVDFQGVTPKYFTENLAGGVFYDENGDYIFHFEKPYAVDANGERTDDVQLLLKREESSRRYVAVIGIDQKWAHAKGRAYPIRIDPTVVHDTSSEFAAGQLNRVNDTGSGSSPNLETYYQELPADEHTAALWHMNDNVSGNGQTISDSSGNGKNGTTNDGANNTGMDCTVSGQLDLGCQFDGTDDLVTIPEDFGFFDGSQDFTLEAWINPDTTHNGRFVVSLQGERDWKFGVTSSGTFIFESYDGAVHTVSADYETGKWQHFVGVYSATGGLSLYKNGELTDTDPWTGTPSSQARQSGIGGETDLFAEYFDGTIDEVKISEIARSPEEIKLAAQRRPYSVFTSSTIDLGTSVNSLDSLSWTELGVTTGDGETVADSSNLVAQWNFNETSGTTANNDAEGSSCGGTPANCDGTLNSFSNTSGQDVVATSGWTSDNRRWGSGSLMFDGSNDYVRVTDNDSLDFANTDFSMEAWVQLNKLGSSKAIADRAYVLFKKDDSSVSDTQSNYGLLAQSADLGTNGTELLFQGADGTSNSHLASDLEITDNKWHHIAAVFDASANTVTFYLDGKSNQKSFTIDPASNTYDLLIGTHFNSSAAQDAAFNGNIDSVRIYSRTLTSSEVLANYNSGQLEFQTRTSADNSTWEAWAPTSNETQILSLDADSANWSWDSTATNMPKSKTDESNIKVEGSGSMKLETGILQDDVNTTALFHLNETNGDVSGTDINDASGNANHLEINGTNLATGVVSGIAGKARNFNGSDDYLCSDANADGTCDDDTDFDITGSLTVEAWVKSDSATNPSSVEVIVAKALYASGANTDDAYDLRISTSGTLTFRAISGGTSHDANGSTDIYDGKWHHVAGVFNAGSTVKVYVDGEEEASVSGPTSINDVSAFLGIGAVDDNTNGVSSFFDGTIDEVRISNTARTAEELAENFRSGRNHRISRTISSTDLSSKGKLPFYIASDRPGTYLETAVGESAFANYEPDANTLALYHLEEKSGSGAYIKDSSGNNYHATPLASPALAQGKYGKGREMSDNSDDRLDPSTDIDIGTNWTVDTWFLSPINDTSSWRTLTRGEGGDHQVIVETGAHRLGTYDNTGATGFKACSPQFDMNTLSDGWHHLAVVQDGTNINFYIDGQYTCQIASYTSTTDIGVFGNHLTGAQPWGTIDEFRVSDVARSAEEIRKAYEFGLRRHEITIDFGASLDSGNLITGSGDTSFTVDATSFGLSDKGSQLFEEDKIIVRENVEGTEYIAQGDVTSVTTSTGAVTVDAWDSGSTFPSGGFTANATVFKWQREYFDITGPLDSQINAVTDLTLRVTGGSEGRTIWLDDMKSAGDYMTNDGGSTISSSAQRYFQYRTIFSSTDTNVSPSLTSVTLTYTDNVKPNVPSLDSPADTATGISLTPELKTTATDDDGDNLQYKIELDTVNTFDSGNLQTFDQTQSQTGWSGQNADGGTTYTSGTQATFTVQSDLDPNTTYYWRSYAIDPNGTNTFSDTQATPFSFTTNQVPNAPTLDSPISGVLTSDTPDLKLTATDPDSDNLQYKIELDTVNTFDSGNLQTFDQTQSQTGWSGQNADGGTTYTSGTQATYTIQSALTKGTTYYWRGYAIDPSGTNQFSTSSSTENFKVSQDPTQPTELRAEGASNPVGVTDTLPEFSAICNDPDAGSTLNKYRIQVDDNSDFSSTVWDSGASGTTMTDCTEGTRSSEIQFGGTELALDGTTYYWRIKFWDAENNEGPFSTENAQFTMATESDDGPTNCRIQEAADDSSLTLLWDDNSANETQFRIEKNVNSGGFSFLVNAAADSTSYEDTDVSQGNTYQYRVRAENGGTSAWCTTDTVSLQSGTLEVQGVDIQGFDLQ